MPLTEQTDVTETDTANFFFSAAMQRPDRLVSATEIQSAIETANNGLLARVTWENARRNMKLYQPRDISLGLKLFVGGHVEERILNTTTLTSCRVDIFVICYRTKRVYCHGYTRNKIILK